MKTTLMPDNRLIKIKQVSDITSLSRSTIYRLIHAGTFPQKIHQGPRAVAWSYNDIMQWVEARRSESHDR